ncbi:C6 transcription factor [Mycena venus]|uniref:C6 transcription factor n=1 Tax=Mycena venus TaxID=2733690 RepID=A0A8H7CRB5_9AGAR|nr:C6 transcription factor [Mycena venus]
MPMASNADSSESAALRNKDGSISKMRAHKGNVPTLPQTKVCPHCSARFTRTTHLTRHMKNHTNERQYKCQTCPAQFTRSDLLARHRKTFPPDDPDNGTSFLPLGTLSKELVDLNALAGLDHLRPAPIASHLSPAYENDAFQSLFRDVFSTSDNSTYWDDFFPAFPTIEVLPPWTGAQEPWFQELLLHSENCLSQKDVDQYSLLNEFFSCDLKAADPKHYLYLFLNTFVAQMPLIHTPHVHD